MEIFLWRIKYLACIPGIFSLVVTAYSLMFLHVNLLTLDIYVYYLPVFVMALVLIIIRKSVIFDLVPGFYKIYGLIMLLVLTFALVIILERMRIGIFFGGSIFTLLVSSVAIFLLLKYSIRKLFGVRKK